MNNAIRRALAMGMTVAMGAGIVSFRILRL